MPVIFVAQEPPKIESQKLSQPLQHFPLEQQLVLKCWLVNTVQPLPQYTTTASTALPLNSITNCSQVIFWLLGGGSALS